MIIWSSILTTFWSTFWSKSGPTFSQKRLFLYNVWYKTMSKSGPKIGQKSGPKKWIFHFLQKLKMANFLKINGINFLSPLFGPLFGQLLNHFFHHVYVKTRRFCKKGVSKMGPDFDQKWVKKVSKKTHFLTTFWPVFDRFLAILVS